LDGPAFAEVAVSFFILNQVQYWYAVANFKTLEVAEMHPAGSKLKNGIMVVCDNNGCGIGYNEQMMSERKKNIFLRRKYFLKLF